MVASGTVVCRAGMWQELKRQLAKYPEDFEKAYKESFVQVNARMHEQVRRVVRCLPLYINQHYVSICGRATTGF